MSAASAATGKACRPPDGERVINSGCGGKQHCRNGRVLQRSKADNNHDPRDRLSAWPPLRELQNGQGVEPKERPDIRMQPHRRQGRSKALPTTCGESPYTHC